MTQLIVSVEGVEIKRLLLTRERTTLGRKPGNDIMLDNVAVSGHHCVFDLRGPGNVFVEDLRSTNGTFINNVRLDKRHRLNDEDVISVVNFRIRFKAEQTDSSFSSQTGTLTLSASARQGMASRASFHVITGATAGLEVPLVKAVTTFGKPGLLVVAVSHRRTGFFVARVEGEQIPTLNGAPIGHDGVLLADHDVLDLGGTRMLFHLRV